MPDRDSAAQRARNMRTLLTVRLPGGLKPRVEAAARRAGETVSAFAVTALERELQERDGQVPGTGPGEAAGRAREAGCGS